MIIKINGTTVDSEVLPINKPTLDETLETFSFALKSTTLDTPYAPMQEVEITTDDDEVINLLIVSDTVEPFSLNPINPPFNKSNISFNTFDGTSSEVTFNTIESGFAGLIYISSSV